jgi:hypothetical protein
MAKSGTNRKSPSRNVAEWEARVKIHHYWTRAITKVVGYLAAPLTVGGVVTITLKIDDQFLEKAWRAAEQSPPAIGHVVLFVLFTLASILALFWRGRYKNLKEEHKE